MYIATILICIVNGIMSADITFDRQNLGITDLTTITIPSGTTTAIFKSNALTFVPAGYFTGLPDIYPIELWINQIADIEDQAFIQVPTLKHLWLGHNQISSPRREMFQGIVQLEQLYLNNNGIQFLPTGIFEDLKSLKLLGLFSNNIKHFDITSAFNLVEHPCDLDLQLENNPIACDPEMCAFVTTLGSWFTVDNAACNLPPPLAGRLLNTLTTEELACGMKTVFYFQLLKSKLII